MNGDYFERRFFSQNPFARICKIYKSDTRFFVDNRENSNFVVEDVPFLPIFVGTYEETFFRDKEVNPMT